MIPVARGGDGALAEAVTAGAVTARLPTEAAVTDAVTAEDEEEGSGDANGFGAGGIQSVRREKIACPPSSALLLAQRHNLCTMIQPPYLLLHASSHHGLPLLK